MNLREIELPGPTSELPSKKARQRLSTSIELYLTPGGTDCSKFVLFSDSCSALFSWRTLFKLHAHLSRLRLLPFFPKKRSTCRGVEYGRLLCFVKQVGALRCCNVNFVKVFDYQHYKNGNCAKMDTF